MQLDPAEHPHRRRNALTGEWVLVSPHRMQRPWLGREEEAPATSLPAYDPACYLCPGNERAGGVRNPVYEHTFVFDNDFAALLPDTPKASARAHPLLQIQGEQGRCRVICFSPRHDLTLAEMSVEQIHQVVEVWAEQIVELQADCRWVQLFENKGSLMGCSNPHPHGQVWGVSALPNEAKKEDVNQRAYFAEHGRPLLVDYLEVEEAQDERIVEANEHWLAVVPHWAIWPFETLLMPRRQVCHLPALEPAERAALAGILRRLLVRYDNLFAASFPYSMAWHGAPGGEQQGGHWQLHAHFYPPLLRSATVKKFMVGYELSAEPQRDMTPEQAATSLRSVSDRHYAAVNSA